MNEIRWQIKASSQRHRKKIRQKIYSSKKSNKISSLFCRSFAVCCVFTKWTFAEKENIQRKKKQTCPTRYNVIFCQTASSSSSGRAPLQTINTSQSFDHLNWNKYPHRPQETITRSLIEPSEQGKAIRRVVKTIRNVVETWLYTTSSLSPTFSRSALNLWVLRWFPFDEAAAAGASSIGADGASLARIRSPSDSESMLDKNKTNKK